MLPSAILAIMETLHLIVPNAEGDLEEYIIELLPDESTLEAIERFHKERPSFLGPKLHVNSTDRATTDIRPKLTIDYLLPTSSRSQ